MTQIVGCGRTVAGGHVAYDIQWDHDPAGKVVRWVMEVGSPDASETVRLVHELVDGRPSEQYVEDVASGRRTPVDGDADQRDQEITVRFPLDVVGVAVEWPAWRAVLVVDGEEASSMVVPTG